MNNTAVVGRSASRSLNEAWKERYQPQCLSYAGLIQKHCQANDGYEKDFADLGLWLHAEHAFPGYCTTDMRPSAQILVIVRFGHRGGVVMIVEWAWIAASTVFV
jgi:hypothetical protein